MSYELDATDKQILTMLQENCRITIKEMAAQLKLSTTPIFDRMKKLEKAGVIKKYVALVDQKLIGKQLTVFVQLSLKEHGKEALNEFLTEIEQMLEVMECHHITGNSDFLLKVVLSDIEAYNNFIINKLSVIPHIGKVESRFSLSERKKTTHIPV